MVKLNKGSAVHRTLQNAVVAAINDPNYSFSLPKLADWESVVSSSVHEKQRLEFVGDAIMHLSVALYLYRLFPDAAPGLYTNMRSALNANATFTHLMVKAGAYELPSQSHSTKVAADSFEVIVAALYMERGFADVYAWVQEQYAPLVAAARDSYDNCLTTSIPSLSTKRHRSPPDPAGTPLLKKIRLSSGRSSPRMAQKIINRMKSKGKVKLCFPTKKPIIPLEMRLHSCRLRTPKLPSPVIDLTISNDSDGEEGVPSNAMQTSQPDAGRPALPRNLHPLPQSSLAPELSGGPSSDERRVVSRLQEQCFTVSQTPSHGASESFSPPASSTTARSSDSFTSDPLAASISKRPNLSQADAVQVPSGTYENPIVVEDSETES